jgi:phosphoglycolate phosphatase-like HAD superfamily hydrolase
MPVHHMVHGHFHGVPIHCRKKTTGMPSKDTLSTVKKNYEFFIGIDSDGCAFDSMEIKHKECFCPNFIDFFDCQAISKYARQVWEFVNLYSTTRGCNRWLGLQRAIKMLSERKECQARGAAFPMKAAVDAYIEENTTYSNHSIKDFADKHDGDMGAMLQRALNWSLTVDATIGRMVHDVPPFPLVRESLAKAHAKADIIVVSQTPVEALEREWQEHDIAKFVQVIAGQEMGTKTEHIALATAGRYDTDKVLMIGDAPGDYKAAQENNALYYPINPGAEEASWERFHTEALDKFFAGDFAGDYQNTLVAEFQSFLPEQPPWEV